MPIHVKYNIIDDDSIRLYTSDSLLLGISLREDITGLGELEEVRNPGIYILLDKGTKRYVGQASSDVMDRLFAHDRAKDWWTDVVFIAHAHGTLSPDKLNYLEAKLIYLFKEAGYTLDNGNRGNASSYISPFEKADAKAFLQKALNGLKRVAFIDLLAPQKVNKATSSSSNSSVRETAENTVRRRAPRAAKSFTITDHSGRIITATALGGQGGAIMQYLLAVAHNSRERQILEKLASEEIPGCLTTKDKGKVATGTPRTGKITENVWFYTIQSGDRSTKAFNQIANRLGIGSALHLDRNLSEDQELNLFTF